MAGASNKKKKEGKRSKKTQWGLNQVKSFDNINRRAERGRERKKSHKERKAPFVQFKKPLGTNCTP